MADTRTTTGQIQNRPGQVAQPNYSGLLSADVAACTDVGIAAQLEAGAQSRTELQQAMAQSRYPLSAK